MHSSSWTFLNFFLYNLRRFGCDFDQRSDRSRSTRQKGRMFTCGAEPFKKVADRQRPRKRLAQADEFVLQEIISRQNAHVAQFHCDAGNSTSYVFFLPPNLDTVHRVDTKLTGGCFYFFFSFALSVVFCRYLSTSDWHCGTSSSG